ncbi:MAG: alpha/beta hydrolase, partial [Rhodospirillales bacterium]|nr:alpha/beta hydrolase [Rhodospirillales bacterium]
FTEDLMWDAYPQEVRETLQRDGVYHEPSDYGEEPYTITKALIDEGRKHLLLRDPVPIVCPVRLIHGMADPDVPWELAIRLAERLESDDVEVTLIKGGGHRLSEPEDLDRLGTTLARLLEHIG